MRNEKGQRHKTALLGIQSAPQIAVLQWSPTDWELSGLDE